MGYDQDIVDEISEERDAALRRVAELEAKCDTLSKSNAYLHSEVDKLQSRQVEDRYVEEIERLREDNARLIRAVCALAEREVKRSEVGDE